MSQSIKKRGLDRRGLDAAFEEQEARKSQLLLEAALFREQGQEQAAASRFAQAAEIEERLFVICERQGLLEKAFVHGFSAAGCWAQAGNFYQAITLCESLLVRGPLPERLRRRIEQYAATLRAHRALWYAELLKTTSGVESEHE